MKIKHNIIQKGILFFYVMLMCMFIIPQIIEAGSESGWPITKWRDTSGPAGGKVTSIDIDPNDYERILATTPWGLFKSSDRGENWYSYGFSHQSLNEVKFNPNEPGVVFIGTEDGLYLSNNYGDDWSYKSALGNQEINSISFTTVDKNLVVVGSERGIYFSENKGETFTKAKTTDSPVTDVKIFSLDPSRIYAGTEEGLWITTDKGESWRNIGENLPGRVLSIEVNPFDNNLVFVGTSYGIYRTANAGVDTPRWSSTGALGANVRDIWLDITNPSQMLAGSSEAGMMRSIDSGENWMTPTENLSDVDIMDILYHPGGGGEVYAATADNGVIRIESGFETYNYINEGLSAHIKDVVASNQNADHLMASTDNGLYVSEDRGKDWERVFEDTPLEMYLFDYELDLDLVEKEESIENSEGEVLYLLKDNRLLYTFDWGGEWEEIPLDDLNAELTDLSVNPINPTQPWIGTDNGIYSYSDADGNLELVGFEGGHVSSMDIGYSYRNEELVIYLASHNELYKSMDSGESFEEFDGIDEDIAPTEIEVNPIDPDELWIGTYSQGIFYSDDGGDNLKTRNDGLMPTDRDRYVPTVHTIEQKPGMPGNLFVGLESGVFFTNDKGENWEKVEGLDFPINQLAVHFNHPTHLYVGSEQGVVKFESYEIPYLGWEEDEYYDLYDPKVYRLQENFRLQNEVGNQVEGLMFKTPSVVEHGKYQFLYDSSFYPLPAEIEGSQETLPGNEKLIFEHELLSPGETWEITAENLVVSFGIEFDTDRMSPLSYDEDSETYQTYTSPSLMSDPTEPAIKEKAEEIVGTEENPLEKAKLIFSWVQDHMEYVPPGNVGAKEALETGEGVCADYSDLFVALSRANGIPARRLSGYYQSGEVGGQFHAWAEFYLEGYGWIPVEATFEDDEELGYFGRLDPNHVFMSWDVVRQEYSEPLSFEEEFEIEEVDMSDKGWEIEENFEYSEHEYEPDLMPPDIAEDENKDNYIYLVIGRDQFYLNDEFMELEAPPYIKNDRTMVPLRMIAESLGSEVNFYEEDREIELVHEGKELILTLDDDVAKLDGEEVSLDVKPEIQNDRTMVPLRFINETFGAEVDYKGETAEIFVYFDEE